MTGHIGKERKEGGKGSDGLSPLHVPSVAHTPDYKDRARQHS